MSELLINIKTICCEMYKNSYDVVAAGEDEQES